MSFFGVSILCLRWAHGVIHQHRSRHASPLNPRQTARVHRIYLVYLYQCLALLVWGRYSTCDGSRLLDIDRYRGGTRTGVPRFVSQLGAPAFFLPPSKSHSDIFCQPLPLHRFSWHETNELLSRRSTPQEPSLPRCPPPPSSARLMSQLDSKPQPNPTQDTFLACKTWFLSSRPTGIPKSP